MWKIKGYLLLVCISMYITPIIPATTTISTSTAAGQWTSTVSSTVTTTTPSTTTQATSTRSSTVVETTTTPGTIMQATSTRSSTVVEMTTSSGTTTQATSTGSSTVVDTTTTPGATTQVTSTGSSTVVDTTTTPGTTTQATSTGYSTVVDTTTTPGTITQATSTRSSAVVDTTTTPGTTTQATSTGSPTVTGTTVTSGGCKIDVLYVIERQYYIRSYINDINGFFSILTEGLKNASSGIDLKVGFMTYDYDVDNEKAFTSNLTQVTLEIENIQISYSSSYYAKKALEYAYYEFVKLKNGKRSDAYTYYVLLSAYRSSSYPAANIGTLIRKSNKNRLFAVGWRPGSSLETDLLAAVGDSKNYFAIDSISSDLVPQRQALLERILCCPSTTTTPVLPNCKLDVAFIVDNSRYIDAKYTSTFITEVLDGVDISSGNVRVAVVTYTSTAVTLFDLNAYNSSDNLRRAVEAMPTTSSYSRYLNVGLEHARDSVFTSVNGDRDDAWNYYVFTGTSSSNTDSIGRDIRAQGNSFLFAIDIGTSYASEWKATIDTCEDDSKYIYISNGENLPTIIRNITSLITTCPQTPSETPSAVSTPCKIDLVFLLDDTTSMSAAEFEDQKLFIIDLMKRINISQDGIKVAVVTYGDNGYTVFSLNRYNTSAEIQTAVQNIARANSAYGRSYRYADRAIEYASENVFSKNNGDRKDASDYYVILTHGYDYGEVEDYVPVLTSDPNNEVFILGLFNLCHRVKSSFRLFSMFNIVKML